MNTTMIKKTWTDLQTNEISRFDMNAAYRIILKETDDLGEDHYIVIYMNSCTKYELYFNDTIAEYVYGCVNINDLAHYEYRLKGQRDQRPANYKQKYNIHKIQQSTKKMKWARWNAKYFNVNHEYRLKIVEPDSNMLCKSSKLAVVKGYIRQNADILNRGFLCISGLIYRYYGNSGLNGYINMEQVVKRELYFTPSTPHHYYGCVRSNESTQWRYRYQGNCVKRVNDTSHSCYKIQYKVPDDEHEWKKMDELEPEFNINRQYRIRLIARGGYIVVERVTKDALYFGVSINKFWSGCVEIADKHSWHYVSRDSSSLKRVGKGNYSVHCVEWRQ